MNDISNATNAGDATPPTIPPAVSNRITIPEIAARLNLGRMTVYSMLEKHMIPAIRLGKRWIVTRYAYEKWERSAGTTTQDPRVQ